ncbi:hypothetical protein NMG60_11019224, partial [Bertholletia excelsa]
MFSLQVHYGGYFVKDNGIRYVRENIAMFYNVNCDRISYIELVQEIRLLSYPFNSILRYKHPNFDLNSGLLKVEFDQLVLEMFDLFWAYHNNVMDLYEEQEGD